jgi:hypothetical protein
MQLSFEYQIESNGIMRVLYKLGVSNADAIVAMAPIATSLKSFIAWTRVLLRVFLNMNRRKELPLVRL